MLIPALARDGVGGIAVLLLLMSVAMGIGWWLGKRASVSLEQTLAGSNSWR